MTTTRSGPEDAQNFTQSPEFAVAVLIILVFLTSLVAIKKADHRHREVMDELCRMDYPRCVIGVDRRGDG